MEISPEEKSDGKTVFVFHVEEGELLGRGPATKDLAKFVLKCESNKDTLQKLKAGYEGLRADAARQAESGSAVTQDEMG